ncbi:AAA family ATPase [Campylobacter concisus]|uniref:AAA family ATPase n=1 Tax=Campylobacter concisus TaxID=199 RepID=UPI001CB88807|nr:AAA family ATPase [Campylobacter concisus]
MQIADNKQQRSKTNFSLNQIFYGPPGTGKTYGVVRKALEIIEGNASNDRSKFKEYVEKGQIKFITFHQSYGYEEFIEGIKPILNNDEADSDKEIKYDVEDGIFKKLCKMAKSIEDKANKTLEFNEDVNFWKMSLGNSQNPDEDFVFEYCIKNNVVLLGFGNWIDFSDCENIKQILEKMKKETVDFPVTAINRLKNEIKNGDIILVSLGNKKLRAVARVTGEYEFLVQDDLDSFVQARSVEWIFVPDKPIDYDKFLYKQFSQMSIYNIKYNLKIDEFKQIFTKDSQKIEKNYVLIIDEINRGNISKIFGELITLIEPSKRLGADDEIMVELPYSKEKFGVPSNLYIIGTMNTADRSIALMDTALRRRFEFVEMMPEYDTLNETIIEGINVGEMLKTINERIEYLYDRDHTIGHAYFINVSDLKTLANVFKNKILPLLQEYFYDDWEKIRLVLGDSQKDENLQLVKIKRNMAAERLFRGKIDYIDDKILYEINSEAFNNPQSYIEIYKNATKPDNDN